MLLFMEIRLTITSLQRCKIVTMRMVGSTTVVVVIDDVADAGR